MNSQTTRRGKGWAVLIAGCLLLVLLLAAFKYWQISRAIAFAESFPERSETVSTVTAVPTEWRQTNPTIGNVTATQFVELRNEVEGVITKLGFRGGASVSEGQLLVQLDDSEERAQLQATRAQLKLAELQVERTAELRRQNLVSKNDYDRAEADKNVLVANAAALAAIIDKKELRAPFNAQTGLHTLQVGQFLAANTLVTALNGNSDEVWIDFNLPQEKANLPIGSTVQVYGRGLTDKPLPATVISADAMINAASRNRAFRALLKNPPAHLRAGAVLTVKVPAIESQTVFKLPSDAIRRSKFGAYVYVLEPAESGAPASYRARRREVRLGPEEGHSVPVIDGLSENELVAAIGAFKLQDGMLANVRDGQQTPQQTDQSHSAGQK